MVKQCQFFTGVLPLTHFYTICTMSFNESLTASNNMLCRVITDHSSGVDIEKMAGKYNRNQLKFIGKYRKIVYDHFKIESCYWMTWMTLFCVTVCAAIHCSD